jgi:8-oxo-dGTP diphosphatase
MSESAKASPGVYVIMRRGEEALFLHRLNTTYQLGKHMLPGGGVEKDEPITMAGVREASEEVGVDMEANDLQPAHFMYRPPHDETGERADYFFVTDTWTGEPRINEPHKCDELAWFPLKNLSDSVPEYVRVAINHWLNGVVYSEFGWEQ